MNFKTPLILILFIFCSQAQALYGSKPLTPSPAFDALATLHLSDPQNPRYDFFCSGVLIAPDKVLTTGSCIETMGTEVYEQWSIFGYEPQLLKVKIKGVKHEVADVILAPTYFEAPGFEGEDLAIIKLKKKVTVAPMKIASLAALRYKLPVFLVARGQIAETSVLLVKNFAGNRVVFTEGSKVGVCEQDSGGALLIKAGEGYQLAGLLSPQGKGCVKQTGFSIYPRNF